MIANRYDLRLSASWKRWFDNTANIQDAVRLDFPGTFQTPLSPAQLTADNPRAIWPGFMLPDTLPILGNQYGDWICVRITENSTLGELVHWYHGGGDWIPVGITIEEAILHDVVDQFRPVRPQMLRGAAETLTPNSLQQSFQRISDPGFFEWLAEGLSVTDRGAADALREILEQLKEGQYTAALVTMFQRNWALEATACDLVELALQGEVGHHANAYRLLSNQQARTSLERGDIVKWLFDVEVHACELNQLLDKGEVMLQRWDLAAATCQHVLARRQDLGWAFDILGWCYQRAGDISAAVDTYYLGRQASSFTDQAVRMGSHWFDRRFGKFSVAQLHNLRDQLTSEMRTDDYLQAIHNAAPQALLLDVHDYWLERGRAAMQRADFETAYAAFYAAGWDLGAQRLEHYHPILTHLSQAAEQAGWLARAAVSQVHLQCLESRLK